MGPAPQTGSAVRGSLLHARAPFLARFSAWDRGACVVLAIFFALLLVGAWRVGPTYDEHYYIASGYLYWVTGQFGLNLEHPPLVKFLVGLPLHFAPDVWWSDRALELVAFPRTWFFQLNGEHIDRNLFLARIPMCLLTAVLGGAVYRVARRLFSPRAAFFGLCAFAFDPNVLAHGRLAALDGGLTVFLFFAVVSFSDLFADFRWRRLLAAGVAFGLANLAKFTSLVLVPFTLACALAACVRARSARPLGWLLGTWIVGLSVFAAGYGFEAKSVAQVWSRGNYLDRPVGFEAKWPKASVLVEAGQEAGLDAERLAKLRGLDLETAIDELGALLAQDDAGARGALATLAVLEDAPGALRRRAFDAVLRAPLPETEKRSVLACLARIELAGDEAWTTWFENNATADWDREMFSKPWIERLTRGVFGDMRPIPLLTAFKGIDSQLEHAASGHGTYFRGRVLDTSDAFEDGNPVPHYYPVVMAVKNPLAFSLLVLVGLFACVRPRGAWTRWRCACLVGFPLCLFALFVSGNALLGVKYVLPVYPFLALWGAGAVQRFPRFGAAVCVAAALEGQVLLPEPALTFPNELMYYNALAGGPVGGPWTTVMGDDWGQDVRSAGRFYTRYAEEIEAAGGLYYDAYTPGDPGSFGLERVQRAGDRPRGIVAVHVVDLYRSADRYGWLTEFEPFERLGWSVYLYDTRVPAPGGNPLPAWERGRE